MRRQSAGWFHIHLLIFVGNYWSFEKPLLWDSVSALCELTFSILITTYYYYYLCLVNEETKAPRGQVTGSRSQTVSGANGAQSSWFSGHACSYLSDYQPGSRPPRQDYLAHTCARSLPSVLRQGWYSPKQTVWISYCVSRGHNGSALCGEPP